MKYAITIGNKWKQKTERVVVYFSNEQLDMCAVKLKEFNGTVWKAYQLELRGELLEMGDDLVRRHADHLLANPGTASSLSTGGVVVQAMCMADGEVQLDFFLDPHTLFLDESLERQRQRRSNDDTEQQG